MSMLFTTLNHLKNGKKDQGGIRLYHQICEPFHLERLYDYFIKKYKVPKQKHYYFIDHKKRETYLLELNYSCLIVLSHENLPPIFKTLFYYSPYLFVCDFENKDYFWLEEVLEKS